MVSAPAKAFEIDSEHAAELGQDHVPLDLRGTADYDAALGTRPCHGSAQAREQSFPTELSPTSTRVGIAGYRSMTPPMSGTRSPGSIK
jgi:hypothetical protein